MPSELMCDIVKMLKGNYRAMVLVHAYLTALTGGV